MEISDKNKQKIIDFLENHNCRIISFGTPSVTGYYRPRIKDANSDISIKRFGDRILIKDFSDNYLKELVWIDGNTGEELSTGNLKGADWNKSMQEEREAEEELRKEREKLFKSNYDKLEKIDTGSHSLFTHKKLKQPKNVFVAKEVDFGRGNSMKNALIVPFIDIHGATVAAQVRSPVNKEGKSSKYTIAGSTLKGAYHIVQYGKKVDATSKATGYVTESFTTACEIAEAAPSAFVVCSAGFAQQLKVFYDISDEFRKTHNFVLVLDKNKAGKINGIFGKFEADIIKWQLPFMQLDKLNPEYSDLTDFNEFALKYGKKATAKLVKSLSARFSPDIPEVLEARQNEFDMISTLTNKIVTVGKKDFMNKIRAAASTEFIELFLNSYNINEETFINKRGKPDAQLAAYIKNKTLLDYFENRTLLSSGKETKGRGIFKEKYNGEDIFVSNLDGGRYLINGDLKYTIEYRPYSNLYITGETDESCPDLSAVDVGFKDFLKINKIWRDIYSLDDSYIKALLGFVAQAAYAGFSPNNSHLWLTGNTGSGKSFLLKNIITSLADGFYMPLENATEAGIRQKLGDERAHNTALISCDEMGTDTLSKKERVIQLINFAREMATNDGKTESVRGTREQEARSYKQNCAFIFCSTTHYLRDAQDISRFLILDLSDKLKRNVEVLNKIESRMEEVKYPILKAILLGAPHFMGFLYTAKAELEKAHPFLRSKGSHKSMALASVVAGLCSMYKAAGRKDENMVELVVKELASFISNQVEEHQALIQGAESVIYDILRTEVRVQGMAINLLRFLSSSKHNNDTMKRDFGVWVNKNKGLLFINASNFQADKFFYSNSVMNKIHVDTSRLSDMSSTDNDMIDKVQNEVYGKRKYCFRIKIPNSYLSEISQNDDELAEVLELD